MARWRRLATLSVGTKWALRYTLVTLFAICALFAIVYDRARDRILKDAELVVESATRRATAAVARHDGDPDRVALVFEREVAASDPDLRLGIQYFGPDGELRIARGFLAGKPLGLHPRVAGGSSVWHFFDLDLGKRYPYLAIAAAAETGYVQVVVYGRSFVRSARAIRDAFLLALPIALLLTTGLGWWLARVSLRPISRITATTRRISGANLDERVPTTGTGDDLDQLASTLNEMIERIRESVARMRRFSADAAHELRTPLAAIRNQIEVTLEKDRELPEYDRVLRQILEEVAILGAGVDGMLRLAESETGLDPRARERVDLPGLLGTVVEFFGPLAEDRGVGLSLRAGDTASVIGDPTWLHRLFANLLDNAIKFTPAGGGVEIELSVDAEGESVAVAVRDTGIGIAPADFERVFERLHKGAPGRSDAGFGLGLALAREIARAHGGAIELSSAVGRGSTFTVRLPLCPAPPQ